MGCECGGGKPRIFVPQNEEELKAALYDAMVLDPEDIRAGNRLDVERRVVGLPLLKQRLHSDPQTSEAIRRAVRAILSLPAFDPDCKNCHLGESGCKK